MTESSQNQQPLPHPSLGVALPLANEADCVESLLSAILVHLQEGDRIYCVLDNVSRDGTRGLVEAYAARDDRVRLVWAPGNRCVVDAYFAGYRAALEGGHEWILEMDGGFSHDPRQIPDFLKSMAEGYDYVGGSRFLPGGSHASPFTRRWVSRMGSILASLWLHTPMTDMTSGYQLYRRPQMQEVVDRGVCSRANFFQTEIRFRMLKYRWKEISIRYSNSNYTIGRSSIREALLNLERLRRAQREGRDFISGGQ